MLSVERQTGFRPPELDEIKECPEDLKYIWDWFLELDSSRTSNGFGVNPITFSDMYSYFQLLKIIPDDIEIMLIRMLDRVALDHYRREQEKLKNKK